MVGDDASSCCCCLLLRLKMMVVVVLVVVVVVEHVLIDDAHGDNLTLITIDAPSDNNGPYPVQHTEVPQCVLQERRGNR